MLAATILNAPLAASLAATILNASLAATIWNAAQLSIEERTRSNKVNYNVRMRRLPCLKIFSLKQEQILSFFND